MADGSTPLRLCRWKAVAALASLLLVSADGKISSNEEYRPDLILDLRQFGYEKPRKFHEQAEYDALRNPLTFLDDDILAVSLFVRNPHPGLSVRGSVLGGPFLFQTIFLDAKSGKILRTQTWSNAGIGCGLFPVSKSTFVVQHDLELSLHSPDGTLLKSLSLDPKDFPRIASLKQSPSGNTLFALRIDRQGNHALRIRTSDLQVLGWMHLPGYFSEAVSDSYFAFIRAVPKAHGSDWGGPPMQLFVRSIDSQDSGPPEAEPVFTTSAPGCDFVVFLDNETLGLSGCHEFVILNKTGTVLYRRQFKQELTGGILPCRSCDLVVFGTYVLRGGSSWLDTFPKAKGRSIMLFNRRTGQFDEMPRTKLAHYVGGSALSPNGCLFARQLDSDLEIYRICKSGTAARPQETEHGH